jgi:hypothetical protein
MRGRGLGPRPNHLIDISLREADGRRHFMLARRPSAAGARLIKAGDGPVLGRGPVRKIKHDFVHVTPTPVFRRIVAFDDRMCGGAKMLGRMSVRRVVATADVTAGPADAQVNPGRTDLQTFLAAFRTRSDVADRIEMRAGLCHTLPRMRVDRSPPLDHAAALLHAFFATGTGMPAIFTLTEPR